MSQAPDPAAGDVNTVVGGTVKIPVKIVKGRVTYLYGTKRPPIRDGATGELVLAAHDVQDARWIQPLIAEKTVPILPAGARILFALSLPQIPAEKYPLLYAFDADKSLNLFLESRYDPGAKRLLPQILASDAKYWIDRAFVSVELTEPLNLLLRGTKQATLAGGRCRIDAIDKNAESLNHAYTLVSEAFEPDRRSHTGNVFERARYFDGRYWRLLRDLRRQHETAYEEVLIAGPTKGRKSKLASDQQRALDFW